MKLRLFFYYTSQDKFLGTASLSGGVISDVEPAQKCDIEQHQAKLDGAVQFAETKVDSIKPGIWFDNGEYYCNCCHFN